MSRILGYHCPQASEQELAAFADRSDQEARKRSTTSGLAEDRTPDSGASCVADDVAIVDGILVGLSGRPLRFRGENVSANFSTNGQLPEAIARRYREIGKSVVGELEGAFTLAIVDPENKRSLLAIDRLGICRMTYGLAGGNLVFGSDAGAVARFPGQDRTINDQALYDFLFMHMIPAPSTAYLGITKLPPATLLEVVDGNPSLSRYWEPNYDYVRGRELEELQAAIRDSFKTAVIDTGLGDDSGAFLSGGLDSSSVAGTLASVSEGQARTFTVGFGEADYDELQYARLANERFGCQAYEYDMTPADVTDAFPRIATAYDEPFGNSSAAPTYFCAKLAADNGVNHLLAGDGGDELFAGNERYVRQSVFEIYSKLPSFIRSGIVNPLSSMFSPESVIMPFRKFRSYVDQARVPLPERFETWNFMYREGRKTMLDPDFAGRIDPDGPLRVMREVWESAPTDQLLERMLWYDWKFTLADNDLRKVGTMCELAGVRVSYPMLHPDVVDLSARVPPDEKIKGTDLRSFFKRTMSEFLPREIIHKKKQGFGLPFGVWLKTDRRLGELVFSLLSDLKSRRIISADFIDNIVREHKDGHASYYGYAIWDLAMLEAWLAEHADG